jgi:hypothetical protein
MALNIRKLCMRPTPKISYDISPYSAFELLDSITPINDQWNANYNHKWIIFQAQAQQMIKDRKVCMETIATATSPNTTSFLHLLQSTLVMNQNNSNNN